MLLYIMNDSSSPPMLPSLVSSLSYYLFLSSQGNNDCVSGMCSNSHNGDSSTHVYYLCIGHLLSCTIMGFLPPMQSARARDATHGSGHPDPGSDYCGVDGELATEAIVMAGSPGSASSSACLFL